MQGLSQEQLEALCREWQGVLRLQDWDVKVKLARQREFSNPSAMGECRWTLPNKQALILLVDPVDYPDDTEWPYDMEQVLVHELLHLHAAAFDAFEDDSPQDVALEQMIECLACGLVRLKRNGE